MTELAIIDSEAFDQIQEVADLRLRGLTETQVARQLHIPRKVVIERYNTWKDMLAEDVSARDEARDRLNAMVVQYDTLVKKSYELLDDLKGLLFDEKVSAQINATLKNIADFEAKRVDALQKAGLLDANDLGDELAEREEHERIIVEILRNDLCPDCQRVVARRLQEVTGAVEAVVVHNG